MLNSTTYKPAVFIYDDEGVSQTSVLSLHSLLAVKLPFIRSVQRISSKGILAGKLSRADLFIMPGGADLPYCKKLNGKGNRQIRDFVASGKCYIGICAGAYYACHNIDFTGDGYQIHGNRELAFFTGTAVGSIASLTGGQFYDGTTQSKSLAMLNVGNNIHEPFYYHGGPYFQGGISQQVLATYDSGEAAIIYGRFGRGQYLLSGVHFELCPTVYANNIPCSQPTKWQEKEQQLLALLQQENYAQTVYDSISMMLGQSLKQ